MDTLWQDLRYAVHQFRAHAGFTLVAVLTLALGIGANTAIFSVVNSVLLEPLAYRQADRLVSLDLKGFGYWGAYVQLQEHAKALDVAAYGSVTKSLTGHGDPVQFQGVEVSSNFFTLLGVDAIVGRTFLSSANQPGQKQVVVLSNAVWKGRFGADPQIVGEQIDLDGTPYTVVGVMPATVRTPNATTQFWVPRTIDLTSSGGLWGTGADLIGRLRPGATLVQAQAEVATLTPQMHQLFPWRMPEAYGRGATVLPLRARIVGGIRPLLLILLATAAFVLLIACVNVVNLLLVRTAARGREIAIRTALGAGRGRLVRQMLTESMLLALLGGVVGLLVAVAGVHVLVASLPTDTPRLAEIGIDGRVLAVTLLVALATGIALGLAPAFWAGRFRSQAVLQEGGRGSSAGVEGRRLSGLLVSAEVAVSAVLVTGAALLAHSFIQILRVDPGFRAEHVLAATIVPPAYRYDKQSNIQLEFYADLVDHLKALPGVNAAAVTSRLPFGGRNYGSVFMIEGQENPAKSGNWPWADVSATVSADYLRAMGVRLLRGRDFTKVNRQGAPRVVLIDESLAKKYWPNEDPIGKRIIPGATFEGPDGADWATIIGIVANVKHDQLNETSKGAIYRPLQQAGAARVMSVVVRTVNDPTLFIASLRDAVASLDHDTPVSDLRTMDDLISTSLARPRIAMALLAAFGLLALVLGAVGIYGTTASAVSQRTREIGVRLALGARPGNVLQMVVRQGLVRVLVGIAIGIGISALVTRFLTGFLYGVRPLDPFTFALVPFILVEVSLLASYFPARRAARVDPVIALKVE